ncbi:unnamed protein product [Allacma fusca]|uniref:PDZ domain-containing protein n=1 Tax=Allacma fusca TaxID=39272 RepID=A0A8J2M6G8_9HEXA|nr:unnamed protein product [Allacma fusca]
MVVLGKEADGSAFNSNLKPGQVLLSVDGRKLDGLTHEDIARYITEAYSDTNKSLIEFMVVEAKNNNFASQQPQGNQQLTPQQPQPSSLVLCSNN